MSTTPLFPFKGIIPPLVTPLSGRDEIDLPAVERLIEHIIAGGVHGVFLLGTSGEALSLSHAAQRIMIAHACQCVGGRIPVLVGITDTSMSESIAVAHFAKDQGADAVVLAAPYYFPMHQTDLTRYVRELAEDLPLPFLLYNMPSHTKVSYEIQTIEDLLDLENFVGVKDSSGNMLFYNKLIQLTSDRPDFSLLMGPEELMAESVLMGGQGGICGGANLLPSLYVELYEAALTGDILQTHKLQQRVMRLSKAVYEVGAAPTGYLTGIKAALSMLGLCSARLSEPLYAMPEQQQHILKQHLFDLGLFNTLKLSK